MKPPLIPLILSNWLVFVDGGAGMVVAPIEPIIFERGDPVEALSLRGAGDGTALKVPLAGGGGVHERPVFSIGLQKEFGVAAVNAADKNAEGFAIGPESNK